MREFGHVFNDQYLRFNDDDEHATMAVGRTNDNESSSGLRLLAIPTNQRAREDLVAVGEHIEEEKDRLLNVVSEMKTFCPAVFVATEWSHVLSPHLSCDHSKTLTSSLTLANISAKLSDPKDTGLTISTPAQAYP